MTRIAAIAPVLPEFSYSQEEILAVVAPALAESSTRRAVLERMYQASTVERRFTALPIERYADLGTLRQSNDEWFRVAVELGVRAVSQALAEAQVDAAEVDLLLFTSVTGVSAPSVDAAVAERLGVRADLRRWPGFGLGCVAGASGLARIHDFLELRPTGVAVLLAVELCSLTLQRTDESMANFVASGLFGDGAAAVVMVGDEHARAQGPRVVTTRSTLIANTADVLGFVLGSTGFEIVLTTEVAGIIEKTIAAEVDALLGDRSRDGLAMVAHPGGPRVLEAFATALGMPRESFERSWRSLAAKGNMSSVSVLHVLADTIAEGHEDALVFAVGPGLSAEFVLLEAAT